MTKYYFRTSENKKKAIIDKTIFRLMIIRMIINVY